MLPSSINEAAQRPPTVLVFDSGVGGLSICQSILSHCLGVRIIYVADNASFPYGTKSEDYLRHRIATVLRVQCEQYQPDILVIACNTASTLVLSDLRGMLNIPVVGVVPAIKPAAESTQTGAIGLLATSATVQRHYTDQLVADFAAHCDVIRVGSSRLVEMAEQYLRGGEVNNSELTDILAAFFCPTLNRPVDKIVLGCTHFPLLRSQLERCTPQPIVWIDSGNAIAKRIKGVFDSLDIALDVSIAPIHHIRFTGAAKANEAFYQRLTQLGFQNFEIEEQIS
ncbi:glutamate racemase [Alkalimarinus sediminis]|uniref:Glutamate racemase n=1 Tax=Alkalimarinus sediminis TaxID=1632866 RepID=A0A9E8HLJ2_9ALTE|nr:glutamate racemase [Alkalimarinus sediminis]UZW75567.1 glutamate racemase [Alkalimarinus sediminis]